MPRRNSSRVPASRLGGKVVLSLDAMDVEPYVAPAAVVSVEWNEVMDALDLDRDERAYFRLNKIERIPRHRLAALLSWDAAKVAAVQRRVDRRIAAASTAGAGPGIRDGGSSLRPFYRTGSGWSLSRLDPTFRTVSTGYGPKTFLLINVSQMSQTPMVRRGVLSVHLLVSTFPVMVSRPHREHLSAKQLKERRLWIWKRIWR
jgi:hypothetical protein